MDVNMESLAGSNKATSEGEANIPLQNWEASNNVQNIPPTDAIYKYDEKKHQDILAAKPWDKDPNFFQDIKISALALLKMVMHARSGGNIEIMGLMHGKVDGNTMIVMDSFALPVEGTETRVNAQAQAYEYMSQYMESAKPVGRLENVIGWYHSHPGYGCWLSGIDVSTQMLNQNFQEPFVAIVIDPIRTVSAGKVCIGAFRTYPKGYKAVNDDRSEDQAIPLAKIEDFGVHCSQYYSLNVSYFKSALDTKMLQLLWNSYWIKALSSCKLVASADYQNKQLIDIAEKLEQAEPKLEGFYRTHKKKDKFENSLTKVKNDCCKFTSEVIHGMISQEIKKRLFDKGDSCIEASV